MADITSNNYNILIDEDYAILKSFINQNKASKIFVIADENTKAYCLPVLEKEIKLNFSCIQIASGEKFKNIKTCVQLWNALLSNGCDRHSLIINLGGGVIGDMGGFVASTYMRGVPFIQVPTTLLSQVDASVGGKLGIDFLEHKNMVGLFNNPELVWIDTRFLKTLPERQLKSGFAEVIKHALIRSKSYWEELLAHAQNWDAYDWASVVEKSVRIKNQVVAEDPFEKGPRKILNFGHTIGHAVESFYLNTETALLHGEAIAIGMVCESYLSYENGMLSGDELRQISQLVHDIYPLSIDLSSHADQLLSFMQKDKKNMADNIMFSSISSIGDGLYNQRFEKSHILKSFEYYENTKN